MWLKGSYASLVSLISLTIDEVRDVRWVSWQEKSTASPQEALLGTVTNKCEVRSGGPENVSPHWAQKLGFLPCH